MVRKLRRGVQWCSEVTKMISLPVAMNALQSSRPEKSPKIGQGGQGPAIFSRDQMIASKDDRPGTGNGKFYQAFARKVFINEEAAGQGDAATLARGGKSKMCMPAQKPWHLGRHIQAVEPQPGPPFLIILFVKERQAR